MRKNLVCACVGLLLIFCFSGSCLSSKTVILFSMDDPAGDDFGPGSYTYPTHEAFAPHSELLDLRRFLVSCDKENVYFDATFATITNPWSAPEGFFHQLIDIFIDGISGTGYVEAKGPNVRFSEKYAWDYRVRVIPFSGSRLLFASEDTGSVPLSAYLLPDEKTIRVVVPRKHLRVSDSWRYYVLIGGFDFFGPENYRQVAEQAEAWSFGGGGTEFHPRIVDMLALPRGPASQERMLGGYDPLAGVHAVIGPVDSGQKKAWLPYLITAVLAASLGAAGWIIRKRHQNRKDI